MCAVRMVCGACKLLLINVYMPYEGNEAMTNDFLQISFLLLTV